MGYYGGSSRQGKGGLFDTWPITSIIAFWLILILLVVSVIFINAPIGLMIFGLVYLMPKVWKDPTDESTQHLGMMVRGTWQYKVATFMAILKNQHRSHIFSALNLVGFGPPESDVQKDLTPSLFRPPARLAAWWALGFGICASWLDVLIEPIVFPIWGRGITMPVPMAQALTAFFLFMTFQAVNTARRYQLATAMPGVDHVPAVMLNKIPKKDLIPAGLVMLVWTLLVGAVLGGIAFLVTTAYEGDMPWNTILLVGGLFAVTCGVFAAFRHLTKGYRREFNELISRREFWNNVWGYKNMKAPFFEMEVPVPGVPGKPGGPPEGAEPLPANVWVATFAFPTNGNYADYSEEAGAVSPSLPNGEMVAITPIPKRDPNTGAAIPGTVSDDGFRVWWTSESIGINQLLTEPDITPEQKEIAVRSNVTEPLSRIRGIGRCIVHSHGMMTDPKSKVGIMRVSIVPPDGVTEQDFTTRIDKITSAIGVPWVRAKKSLDGSGRSVVELYVGNGGPNSNGVEFPSGAAASRYRTKLLSVDWEYVFAVNKIASPSGSPSMMLSKPVTDSSDEIVFDLPAGVSYKMIEKKVDELKTTSGNSYLEIHDGIVGEKNFGRREKRELDRYRKANESVSQFTAVAASKHPLEDMFYFSSYKDQLITGREPGVAKIAWSPGVKANGTLAKHSFASDMAHLVLAGSSGSGKSVLIYSMICQLAANNAPTDLQFWIVDPKIGFQNFQHMDSVTRYVDTWTPRPGQFFQSVRDLLADAVGEMTRRNEIFRFAKTDEPIDKLGVARRVALSQGPMPDGSPNPLMQPYIIIVIDEVAMLFAGAPDKESKDLQAEILYYASKLARESRSAGIHCLFSTQYPTTQSLPSLIKQQSGRIGLMTQDGIASKVIIDQPGLEDLWIKGTGKVGEGKGYFDFRGFLLEDGDAGEHAMMDIINSLPSTAPEDGDVGGSTLPGDPEYVELPEADATVFSRWDNTDGSISQALRKMVETGDSAKFMSTLDKRFADMDEKELNQMTLEEFKGIYLSRAK